MIWEFMAKGWLLCMLVLLEKDGSARVAGVILGRWRR